ncbi:MAG TPA: NADPH-dependent F420 reductase [Gemmatimonadales bacterium]|nr:NADPH-dependent F420 reductase [Gemmatimonadales bacterium]
MRITVIGAGNVGGTLGRRWAELGHDVTFGLRKPEQGAAGVKGGGALPARARVASIAEAITGAEVVLLATPWDVTPDALRSLGALEGVILIDATNPLGPGLALQHGPHGESGGEQVQAMVPQARVVKAFATTGYNNMADPIYDGAATAMFYAGDDTEAKRTVAELVRILGFDAIDAGPLRRSRELEHMASLWIALAVGIGVPAMGREMAFRVVRR